MPHGRPRNVAFVAIATTPKLRQNLRQTSRAPRHCLLVGASSGHQNAGSRSRSKGPERLFHAPRQTSENARKRGAGKDWPLALP